MSSGKKTREYTSVLKHMTTTVNHLKVNSEAKESLTTKYQENGWIDANKSPRAHTIVAVALQRISSDANQYNIFMGMLMNIVGMDKIVKAIQG